MNVAHDGLLVYPSAMEEPNAKVSLSPAPRRKLTETVAEQLLAGNSRAARRHEGAVGTGADTKELGVGRSTVREALNGLAMLGIVEIRHGQGVFVTGEPAARLTSRRRSPPRSSAA